MWTQFWDMHSGGGQKESFSQCFIEAPEEEAKSVFYVRFGHNPDRVSCTCCGSDYSISESESLEQATAYHRNLRYMTPYDGSRAWRGLSQEERQRANEVSRYLEPGEAVPEGMFVQNDRFIPGRPIALADYIANDDVLVIRAEEITEAERSADLPEQGYVWRD